MSTTMRILLVDDRVDDVSWLVDDLQARGYEVDQVTNEKAARLKLEEIRRALSSGRKPYMMAIVDIMLPVMDIMELVDIDEEFFEDSARTGVRLCQYAREGLRIKEEELPIVSLTSRSDDEDIRKELEAIGICLIFSRVPQNDEEDIRLYLDKLLSRNEL